MKVKAKNTLPVTLTIAGSDCSAGAGIQADLKTFSALGVYGLTALTGVVAESPLTVSSFQPVSAELLADQLSCLAEAYPISVIKTGLLFNPDLVEVVAKFVEQQQAVLIIDPICVASTGTTFTSGNILKAYQDRLIPLASLVTPNLKEAQILSASKTTDQKVLAKTLWQKYEVPFLVKGGHSDQRDFSVDFLIENGEFTELKSTRLTVPDLHGTGCVLSSAIASYRAQGKKLPQAILLAKQFIEESMRHHFSWKKTHALNTIRHA